MKSRIRQHPDASRLWIWRPLVWLIGFACFVTSTSSGNAVIANDLDQARGLVRTGDYEQAVELAKVQVAKRVWNEAWPRLLIENYLTLGKYDEARSEYESAVERFGDSLRLRMLGYEVYRRCNDSSKAEKQLEEIEELIQRAPWRYSNRSELVPVGEFYLLRGEDPKQVLKICFDQAIQLDPKNLEAYTATARMALAKNDAQVAAQALDKALPLAPNDPEILYLAAKAWKETERGEKESFLKRALDANPKYVPGLLYAAEIQMDREGYETARKILDQVELINPKHPMLWSLRAAIAHLVGDYRTEGSARTQALAPWKLNPEVDHTIGKHLSLHYRFQEGAEYQRRALSMNASYGPARAQLAQDLLRLGQTEEGWALVDSIRQSDPYDVSVYNLKQLQAKLAKFTTLEAPGFIVRMDAQEAAIYGDDVLELLTQARDALVPKYRVELEEPIYVEIFPRQQEFAIRTFGLPGGAGFLGVCFGRLITANSPAALQVDSNWRSVLWHEYCHVVTLQKTKNKMPRWLSEGISVYEERMRDPTWGERLDPTYREMLLGDDLFPISRLSSAFLSPKSPLHLQFAYYTSSLAVEFWIERFGIQGLQKLLDDLAIGMRPEEALARMPGSLEILDSEFVEYARTKALQMAPIANFERPSEEESVDIERWLENHPNSYWGQRLALAKAMEAKEWEAARAKAEQLIALWPEDPSDDGIYWQLAIICKTLGDAAAERDSLVQLVSRASSPREGLLRLIELDRERAAWTDVLRWCELLVGIQPINDVIQDYRSQAATQVADHDKSLRALKAMAAMDPIDPAGVFFRIAQASAALKNADQAKRYCLQALEESPRYREALALLLQLQPQGNTTSPQDAPSP